VLIVLSLFGCVCTITTFILFNDMRTYPIKLILYLCMSIFFAQLFFYLTFYLFEDILCIGSAMVLHYFFLASFFWTFCVAFNFYQMIVRRNRDAETLEKVYHLVSWGLPLVVVVIVVSTESYANIGGYCYMLPGLPIFLSFFLPGLIIVSANAVIFFFIAREIHDTLKSAPKADKKEKSKEFRVYFSIFVSIGLSWILGFIMTFLSDIGRIIFLILYSVLTPLQGFLIFLSYCLNAKVGSRWAGFIGKFLPVFRRWENLGSQQSATSTTSAGTTSRTHSRSSRSNNTNSNSTSSASFSTDSSNSSKSTDVDDSI